MLDLGFDVNRREESLCGCVCIDELPHFLFHTSILPGRQHKRHECQRLLLRVSQSEDQTHHNNAAGWMSRLALL